MIARHGARLSLALRIYLCQDSSDWQSLEGTMFGRQSHALQEGRGSFKRDS